MVVRCAHTCLPRHRCLRVVFAGLCTSLISAPSTHSYIHLSVRPSACVRACMRMVECDCRPATLGALVRADMLASDSSEHEDTVFPFVVEHDVEPDPEPHMLSPPKAQRQGSRAAQPSSQAAGERCQSAPYRVTRSPIALAQAAELHHVYCSKFHTYLCSRVRAHGWMWILGVSRAMPGDGPAGSAGGGGEGAEGNGSGV
jgi:hypothetical protein